MVQRNRDIEQDVSEILSTREELTQKIELLRRRMRGATWHTKYRVVNSLDDVKDTIGRVRRLLNPSSHILRHAPAMITATIILGYLLWQRRRQGSHVPRRRPLATRRETKAAVGRLR